MAEKYVEELKKRDLIIYPKPKSAVLEILTESNQQQTSSSSKKKKKSDNDEVDARQHVTEENAINILDHWTKKMDKNIKISEDFQNKQGYFYCTIKLGTLISTSDGFTSKKASKKNAARKLIEAVNIPIRVPNSLIHM
jgi:hypothetical protein